MTHDKVRQDFEAHYTLHRHYTPVWFEQNADGDYVRESVQLLFNGFKEGRAAERAEIREKLESDETEYEVAYSLRGLGWKDNAERAKAAITKILEVI